jgi:hypothetical protein
MAYGCGVVVSVSVLIVLSTGQSLPMYDSRFINRSFVDPWQICLGLWEDATIAICNLWSVATLRMIYLR